MRLTYHDLIDIVDAGYDDGLISRAHREGKVGDGLAEFIVDELKDTFESANSRIQIGEAVNTLNHVISQIEGMRCALLQVHKFLEEPLEALISIGMREDYSQGDLGNNLFALDKFLLKRLKDKDLPLFINYPWSEETKQVFLTRLKG